MLQTIQADLIFDMNKALNANDPTAYWLAQLRKADWLHLLEFVDVKMSMKTRKQQLAEAALPHFEFTCCEGRGEVWQLWNELRQDHRILVIQFRHSETDWTRGMPEFVDLEKNEPLGFVNIAGRLFCKVK
jgi:hypothetical protein